jgi:hypothetical protein
MKAFISFFILTLIFICKTSFGQNQMGNNEPTKAQIEKTIFIYGGEMN